MKQNLIKSIAGISALALTLFISCEKDPGAEPDPKPTVTKDFQLAFANGTGNPSGTLLQGVSDLTQGEITFSGKGYELTSSRTARVFVSDDGSTVYSLNYTQGVIDKLTYHGGQDYRRVKQLDASIPLGVKALRFTKLDEKEASLHYIEAKPAYENETEYVGHTMIATIGLLDLEKMELKEGYNRELEVKIDDNLAREGYYVDRIDAPVVSGGKLYYGARARKYDARTGKNVDVEKTLTLVVDYPSLANATVIQTDAVKGSTNGYRMATQYKNEAGEILQIVDNGGETYIVKIKNGQYDPSFRYSLHTLLKKEISASAGWHYAGNGIGYVLYEDLTTDKEQTGVNHNGEPTYSGWWKLARVDLNNNTAVDLNVPDKMWLFQYQHSVVRDGKFYIALSPVGGKGHIYIFDVNATSPEGTKGAAITSGADQNYIGIY